MRFFFLPSLLLASSAVGSFVACTNGAPSSDPLVPVNVDTIVDASADVSVRRDAASAATPAEPSEDAATDAASVDAEPDAAPDASRARDASVAIDAAASGPHSFPCGAAHCSAPRQICVERGITFQCVDLPSNCSPEKACSCVSLPTGDQSFTCNQSNGEVKVVPLSL